MKWQHPPLTAKDGDAHVKVFRYPECFAKNHLHRHIDTEYTDTIHI